MTKNPAALDVFPGGESASEASMEYSDPMEELKLSFRPLLSMVFNSPPLQTKQFVDALCFKTLWDIHEFLHKSMMSTSIATYGFDVLQDSKGLSMSRDASDIFRLSDPNGAMVLRSLWLL
jgi:hypothetical protein